MFCARCAGSGKIMGNGMIPAECVQCAGKGNYESAVHSSLHPTPTPGVYIVVPESVVSPSDETEDIPNIPFADMVSKVPICPKLNKIDKRSKLYRDAIYEIMETCDVNRKEAMIMFAGTYTKVMEARDAN